MLYRLPLPKTKLVAPVPDGVISGRVVVDGVVVDVVGWRATVGHNWGREHAEKWVWLHAAGFSDEPEAWLELALARVRVGGALSPWIANGAVFVGGRRFRLGGLGHVPGVRVVAAPGRLEAIVPGKGVEVRVAAHADLDQTVNFTYTGTRPGDTRSVLHAGLAERAAGRAPPRPLIGRARHRRRRRLRARRPRAGGPRRADAAVPGPVNQRSSADGPRGDLRL